jgi:hypothetical protein
MMRHSSATSKAVSALKSLPSFIAFLAIGYLTYVLFLYLVDLLSDEVPSLPQAYTPALSTLSSL